MTGMNPLSTRASAKKRKVSQTTLERIIHKDLHGILRKKYKVHALSNRQIQQRLERAPLFLEYLKGERYKKIITVDECWIFLTYVNGVRRIYYEFKGQRTEESWTKFWKERHPNGVMCFMRVSYWGKTKLRFVKPGAKIDARYYVEHLLKPLFAEDIPAMFRGHGRNPVFHHDNAPSHEARFTQEFLEQTSVEFIPKQHWLGNACDVALIDFFVNGEFKCQLFHRHPTTVDGLKLVATEVCNNLDQAKTKCAFQS